MTEGKFLDKRFNNWLTLVLGIPAFIYTVVVIFTPLLSDFSGFIGMTVVAVVY